MTPISFKETNRVAEPDETDPPKAAVLPFCVAVSPSIKTNPVTLITKWKLSDEELARINQTGEFWICVFDYQCPAFMPTVHNPFTELNFKPKD